MNIQEAISLMMRAHAQVIAAEMDRIDLTRWSPTEKQRQKRAIFDAAIAQFAERGWATAEAYLKTVHQNGEMLEKERKDDYEKNRLPAMRQDASRARPAS